MTLLLYGETGTGKELLANAVHELSSRAGAFVAVNCGAIPEALVESQLFGHARGAFSGAVNDAPGFVRSAEQGTLLLDEVQDLSPSGIRRPNGGAIRAEHVNLPAATDDERISESSGLR